MYTGLNNFDTRLELPEIISNENFRYCSCLPYITKTLIKLLLMHLPLSEERSCKLNANEAILDYTS